MHFDDVLSQRRSIRKFLDKPVGMDLIKRIIKECTYAPSAGNEQSWNFIVIQNNRLLHEISEDCKKNLLARIAENPDDYAKKYKTMLQNESFNIFYNAPCLVIILGDRHIKNLTFDCTLAASYFMMSATANGLGTCWINFARELTDQALLEQIGIPDDHIIVAPIIVGYPVSVPPVPSRNEANILKIIT